MGGVELGVTAELPVAVVAAGVGVDVSEAGDADAEGEAGTLGVRVGDTGDAVGVGVAADDGDVDVVGNDAAHRGSVYKFTYVSVAFAPGTLASAT